MSIPRIPSAWIVALALAPAAFVAAGCDEGGRGSAARDTAGSSARESRGVEPVQVDMEGTPVATSLLGEPLYPVVEDSATTARLHAQLDSAEAAHEADPDDADALIWLGRRYAYAGYYREAIEIFTEGIEAHPEDARFYRHRGHRYITVRELDRAVDDLEHAARMISGSDDVAEPDGMPNEAGVPRSTLHTNIWYHLGLARYLQHRFEGAAYAFRRGWQISPNDDMRVAMADWLWLALKRLGRHAEAATLLEQISPEMEILENDAYLHRLLVYKGELSPDSLTGGSLADADPLDVATHGYGLGAWRLVQGDLPGARAAFRQVLETRYWPAFGYIAAEAELREMGDAEGPGSEPTSGS
ncbi:MAG: tetratricopeptide repeat protein [Longimicrobiales bacterium]